MQSSDTASSSGTLAPPLTGGLGEPAQPLGLAFEEALGRLGAGLDDGAAAVAQPQPGRGADVAAGHRGGGHDAMAEQGFRACRGPCHACHGFDVTA